MVPNPNGTLEHQRHLQSIRMECLKLAFSQSGPTVDRLKLAQEFMAFVLGEQRKPMVPEGERVPGADPAGDATYFNDRSRGRSREAYE